jgi:N-acetylglucosaminyldiphosphoundecaprenol N-acetyl-beta-D-mannosaminyltransferase
MEDCAMRHRGMLNLRDARMEPAPAWANDIEPRGLRPERGTRRLDILGITITPTNIVDACSAIEGWIADGRREYVCVTGAHGIIEARRNSNAHRAHAAAGMVVPDGMPLVFMARRLGFPGTSRVYGPDLMRRLTEISATKGYRQFYYGGPPGLAERLATTLRASHPRLQVAGTLSPPFQSIDDEGESEREIEFINSTRPDIVWVGLSTPKQELWMSANRRRLHASVLIGVGAAFDFLAGTKRQAPGWMQQSGLEWSYRLASEPRRLWKRYARVVPTFAALAIWQFLLEGARRGHYAE